MLMNLTHDTSFSASLEYQIGAIEDMGFKEILKLDIPDTKDHLYIYWRSGVLLCFDSYNGKTMNGGAAYFNYRGPWEAMPRCSHGLIDKMPDEDGVYLWHGKKDAREGLRFCLDTMDEMGEILETWVEQPGMWLLNYMDTKVEVYDADAITAERIKLLPEEVQKAIAGKDQL